MQKSCDKPGPETDVVVIKDVTSLTIACNTTGDDEKRDHSASKGRSDCRVVYNIHDSSCSMASPMHVSVLMMTSACLDWRCQDSLLASNRGRTSTCTATHDRLNWLHHNHVSDARVSTHAEIAVRTAHGSTVCHQSPRQEGVRPSQHTLHCTKVP